MSKRRTCDIQEGDEQWTADFSEDIAHLCGLVEEAFVENKACLLSPVLRKLIADKGREVKAKLQKVRGRLVVDNLHNPLDRD